MSVHVSVDKFPCIGRITDFLAENGGFEYYNSKTEMAIYECWLCWVTPVDLGRVMI